MSLTRGMVGGTFFPATRSFQYDLLALCLSAMIDRTETRTADTQRAGEQVTVLKKRNNYKM